MHQRRHDKICGGIKTNDINDICLLLAQSDLNKKEKAFEQQVIEKYGTNIFKSAKPNSKYPCKSMCSNSDNIVMLENRLQMSRHLKKCKLCKGLL